MTLLYLPDPGAWPQPAVVPRDTLNGTATPASITQLTLAAENAPLRVIYGQVRLGPQLAYGLIYQNKWVLLAVWGHGEIDSYVATDIDDKPSPAGATWTNYTGTQGQGIDPTMVAAFAAQSPPIVYTDTLPGIAYSVVSVPMGESNGFPRLNALIKGLKVYDPRENFGLYSTDFNSWNKANLTVTSNVTIAPNGTLTGDKLVSSVATGRISVSQSISMTAGLKNTAFVYAKAAEWSHATIFFDALGISEGAYYGNNVDIDLVTGVSSQPSTINSVLRPDGWVEMWLAATPSSTGSIPISICPKHNGIVDVNSIVGDGASGIYLWGFQNNNGSAPLAHALTTTTQVVPITQWSDVPALCLADFIVNPIYGKNDTVVWSSVGDVANDNSYMVGEVSNQERLRTLNLAIETKQTVQAWLDTLRTYAGCWIVPTAAGMKLVSDKARASVASYSHSAGNIKALTSLKKAGVQTMPTVLTVTYTDTTTTPYRDGQAVVYAAGVVEGTTPRRESTVALPGINRYSQAYREGIERVNKLLCDLSFNVETFDEGIAKEVGDVVEVTFEPLGLTSKLMWISSLSGSYGRYSFNLQEYDPANYNFAVASAPTYPDTTLLGPSTPPEVTNVNMVEELFELENGLTSSRWRVTWDCADYMFLREYRAELWIGSTLIHAGSPTSKVWPTPSIQEGQTYVAKIAAVSSIGSVGHWGTDSEMALGKQLVPGNVPSISAFEAGGRVYASWTPAVDIDIWRYEVRYGAVGTAWASCMVIDRVDALTLTTDLMPVGTWTLKVKAIDSVAQESATEASVTVTVTADAAAFLVDTKLQTAPTLTNMQEYALNRTDANRYFITEDNVSFATKFPSSLSTYSNALATYHNSLTSTWLGEVEDFGLVLGGQWTGTGTIVDVSGAHISYLGHSPDNSAWTYPVGLSQKVNARFARLKHEALTTSTLKVVIPDQDIRIDAVPREELGTVTSSSSGPVTVVLVNDYVALKKLTLTPQGTSSRSTTFDNVQLNNVRNPSFEVDVLDWGLVEGTGTVSRSTVAYVNGIASLKFDSTTSSCAYGSLAVHVTPGQTLNASAWVWASGAVASGFYMRLSGSLVYPTGGYETSALRTTLYDIQSNAALAAGWQKITGAWVVPANVYWVSLCFYHWTGMSGVQLNIDDVVLSGFDSSFDVYSFDYLNNKTSTLLQYEFQGV